MTKGSEEKKQNGCFAWLIRVKQSVNERWARARNSFRKKFYRENGKSLAAEELLNETGAPDMIISKVPIKAPDLPEPNPLEAELETQNRGFPPVDERNQQRESEANSTSAQADHVVSGTSDGEPDDEEVRRFVEGIVQKAKMTVTDCTNESTETLVAKSDTISVTSSVLSELALRTVHESLTNVIQELNNEKNIAVVDTDSLSSGAISDLAELAVTESLSKIMTEQDSNQSAKMAAPGTVSEVLERLGISPDVGTIAGDVDSGLPVCSS